MPGRKWTTSDIAELKKLCGSASSRDIAAKLKRSYGAVTNKASSLGLTLEHDSCPVEAEVAIKRRRFDPSDPAYRSATISKLRSSPMSMAELAAWLGITESSADLMLDSLKGAGYHIVNENGRVRLGALLAHTSPKRVSKTRFTGPEMKFGVIADCHLASNRSRLDVLEMAYNEFQRQGVKKVYCVGNLIDGYAERINGSDVYLRNLTDQCVYMADHLPQRSGMTTEFITGDCHEGWYIQRAGVNVGHHMEDEARRHGRNDIKYLGHMEADVELRRGTGRSVMRLFHPGGGSAYAQSYKAQKIVECVPLDSEILTPLGWRTHEQLAVGDTVMGYNLATGTCEWTVCRGVHRGRADVDTYKNDNYVVRCTPNHKWAMERESRGGANPDSVTPANYRRKDKLLCTIEEAKERSRIIQAAPGPDGPGIAWSMDALLDRTNVVQNVLRMTSAQRQAFIRGMMLGEGTQSSSRTLIFSQRPGPVMDGMALACFLEGIAPGMTRRTTKRTDGGPKVCGRMALLRKPNRMVTRSLHKVATDTANVWCPTTDLGTWVMRQGDVITITGNSYQGGEKPHILLIGHFHKLGLFYPRGVWCLLAGCTQDQTVFMRRKHIDAHLGFSILTVGLDKNGGVAHVTPKLCPFYDRKYHVDHGDAEWEGEWEIALERALA